MLVLAVTACGGPPPERASTITPPATETAGSPTKTSTTAPAPADLKKLLLGLDDMPSGWSQEKVVDTAPTAVTPASCLAMYTGTKSQKARAATKFTHGQVDEIRERIYSFDVSADDALDASRSCGRRAAR